MTAQNRIVACLGEHALVTADDLQAIDNEQALLEIIRDQQATLQRLSIEYRAMRRHTRALIEAVLPGIDSGTLTNLQRADAGLAIQAIRAV